MKLPDSIAKRDILFGARRASAAEILTLGKAYASEGHLSDAIDFFVKADARTELEGLISKVIEEGDTFLLLKILRTLGEERVTDAMIAQCSEKAQSLGKIRYAIMGHEKLGQKDKAEALRDTIAQDGDIIAHREAETFIAQNLEEIQGSDDESADA
jgi:aminoglycoside/choline kinase family phosphotransferase